MEMGLQAATAYDVSQREKEIGIRKALGADRRAVLGLVLRGGLQMAVVGVLAAALLAFASARIAGGLCCSVFRRTTRSPYGGLGALLVGLAAAAAYLPARRVTALSPVDALR